eukprot:2754014-Karenia_brevis.AAC.1
MQPVKPSKFHQEEAEDWDEAGAYIHEHGIIGDAGPYVDKHHEKHVEGIGLDNKTRILGSMYSQWSTQATVVL